MQNFGERRFVFQEAVPDPFKVRMQQLGKGAGELIDKSKELAKKVFGPRKDVGAELADELATPGLGEAFDMVGLLRDKFDDPEFLEKNPPIDLEEAKEYRMRLMAISEIAAAKGVLNKEFDLFGSKVKIIQGLPRYEAQISVHVPDHRSSNTTYSTKGFQLDLFKDHLDNDLKYLALYTDGAFETKPAGSTSFLATKDKSEIVVFNFIGTDDSGKLRVFAETILPRIEQYLESL